AVGCRIIGKLHQHARVDEHGPKSLCSVDAWPDVLGRGFNAGAIQVLLGDVGKAELAVRAEAAQDGVPIRTAAPRLRPTPINSVSCWDGCSCNDQNRQNHLLMFPRTGKYRTLPLCTT